jgi:hypothetical protein
MYRRSTGEAGQAELRSLVKASMVGSLLLGLAALLLLCAAKV